jgi:hypothetical protein
VALGLRRLLIFGADIGHVACGGQVGDAGHVHDGLAKGGKARDGQLPGLLQHVQAGDDEGDRREGDSEQGECGNEFANEIDLGRDDNGQEPPEPGTAGVVHLPDGLTGGLASCVAVSAICVAIYIAGALRRHRQPPDLRLVRCNDVHFRSDQREGQCTGGELRVDRR